MKIPRYPLQPTITKKQICFLSIPVLLLYIYIIYWIHTNPHKHSLQYGYNCNGHNCKITFNMNESNLVSDTNTDLMNNIKATINQAKISHIFNRLGGYRAENAIIMYIKKQDPRTFKKNVTKRKIICKAYPHEIGKIFLFSFLWGEGGIK